VNAQRSPGWSSEDVLRAFERRGYQRVELPGRSRTGSLRYESPNSSENVRQYVQFNLKARYKAYEIWAGYHNSAARSILERFQDRIKQLSAAERNQFRGAQGPFWTAFGVTRLLNGFPLLPDPTEPHLGPQQFALLVERFLEPRFENTRTPSDMVDRLLSEEKPMEWFASSRVARAADVLATAVVAGRASNLVIPQLLQRSPPEISVPTQWSRIVLQLANLFDYG